MLAQLVFNVIVIDEVVNVAPPVDAVCVSPAAVRVRVPVASVDEGVFEWSADVLCRQTRH